MRLRLRREQSGVSAFRGKGKDEGSEGVEISADSPVVLCPEYVRSDGDWGVRRLRTDLSGRIWQEIFAHYYTTTITIAPSLLHQKK